MSTPPVDRAARVAARLELPLPAVTAALALFDEGATVPFVARYRKERTGGLDEVQLRAIAETGALVVELDQRREAIRASLREAGKLTPELAAALDAAGSRRELEDLYAPHKRKRKTRADLARERGLAPLADLLRAQGPGDPTAEAARFVSAERGVPDAAAALAGARDIVAEGLAVEHGPLVRRWMRDHGVLTTQLADRAPPEADAAKFRDHGKLEERIGRMPSHRYLAVCRGEAVGALKVKVRPDPERTVAALMDRVRPSRSPWGAELRAAAEDALERLMLPAAERSVRAERKEAADLEAIDVFATNLEALLLAPPFGPRPVVGIDPGIRTGCKCASVGAAGEVRDTAVFQLVRDKPEQAALARWLRAERPAAVAVGNGTGGREALAVARAAAREAGIDAVVVPIAETGASVYSASDGAREELPDLDLTLRSAVHLARRLQDPLAELVKVPPASLGVGQYQHDVDQAALERRLHAVVESCVNRVGVDVNTASAALLKYVAGIGPKLGRAIVAHRHAHGPFPSRRALLDVPGIGPRTFEQCAGFLRVRGGDDPLDASGVHPERAPLVRRMARDLGLSVAELVGNAAAVARLDLRRYEDADTGRATLDDIAAELRKPGRDPRDAFEAPAFRDDVRAIEDLVPGMVLEGVVTNVTAFGAFVDLGVHHDGLVHVSELADRFVRAPSDVVSPGQRIVVKVIGVDLGRKRISLSAKQASPRS